MRHASTLPHANEPAAVRLDRARNEVIEEWEKRARSELPSAPGKEHYILIDSLPQYLDELVDSLRVKKTKLHALKVVSKGHAMQRSAIPDYTLEQVQHEYRILRAVVFEILERQAPLAAHERDIIYEFISEGKFAAAQEYVHLAQRDLQRSEERLSVALSSAEMGIFDWDVKTGKINWSDTLRKLWGLDQFSGDIDEFWKRIHPEDVTRIKSAIGKAFRDHTDYAEEYRVIWPDQSVHWLSVRGRAYQDEQGETTRFSGTAIDITERKYHELEYAALFEYAGTGKAVVDPETRRYVLVNQAFANMLGYTKEELMNLNFTETTDPSDQLNQEYFEDEVLKDQRKEWTFEKRYLRKDGTPLWTSIHVAVLPTTDSHSRRHVCTIIDISEQKAAEESLMKAYQDFKTLTDSLPLLLWWTDEGGGGNHFNQTWFDYTGIRKEDMDGTKNAFLSLIHPEDREKNMQVRAEALKHNREAVFEERVKRYDGQYRWHLVRAKPVTDPQGRLLRWYASSTDIHDLKTAEERLSRAIEAREDLLAVVSHDLRNPLGSVMMSANLLARRASDDEFGTLVKTKAESIQQAGRRMNDLIEDLLSISKIESGTLVLKRNPVSPADLVNEAVELMRPFAAKKRITIELNLAETDRKVCCDFNQALRVLTNLLSNAIKFTPDDGLVKVETEVAEKSVEFRVEDTGPGIAQHHLPHLFERYWQARGTAHQGTGLGLSIAKGIIVAHHGKIGVKSNFGSGALFYFTLPTGEKCANETHDH